MHQAEVAALKEENVETDLAASARTVPAPGNIDV